MVRKCLVVAALAAAVGLAACGDSNTVAPANTEQGQRAAAVEVLQKLSADAARSTLPTECMEPQQLDGQQWFTLCGQKTPDGYMGNAGLWELRTTAESWDAYASNGKALGTLEKIQHRQVHEGDKPPKFDTGKARGLFR